MSRSALTTGTRPRVPTKPPEPRDPSAESKRRNHSVTADLPPQESESEFGEPFQFPKRSKSGKEEEKRGREEDRRGREDENRGKRSDVNPIHQETEDKVGVYLETMERRHLLDTTVAKQLHEHQLKVNKIISKGYSQILVLFDSAPEANKLINHPTILSKLKCKATLSLFQSPNKGIIHGIDLDITEQELMTAINKNPSTQVTKVTRMTKYVKQASAVTSQPLASVTLEFAGTVLPNKVYFYNITRNVNVYVDIPRVCFRCQKFGHMAKQCRSTAAYCGFCAQNHNTRDCPKDKDNEVRCCINCQGTHSPRSLECPVMQHKYNIRMEQTLKKTLYQPVPQINSHTDFPGQNPTTELSHPTATPQEPAEPTTLPPAAQKARVKRFSEVLASGHRTEQQNLERRHQRYQHTARIMQNKENKTISHRQPPPAPRTPRIQDASSPNQNTQQEVPAPTMVTKTNNQQFDFESMTDSQMDTLMLHMVSSKRALAFLITILQVVSTMYPANQIGPEPANMTTVQNEVLRRLQIQTNTPDTPEHTRHQESQQDEGDDSEMVFQNADLH
jgi:Zinc knuckle